MKKILTITLLSFLLIFTLVGCSGTKTSAPTDLKIVDGKITFTGEGETFICEIKKPDGTTTVVNVNNGDDEDVLYYGLGDYEIKIKAIKDGVSSEWSSPYAVTRIKLAKPKNVKIENNRIYFDNVIDADSYQVIFVSNGEEITKELNSGAFVNNLGLAEGTYDVYVVANKSAPTDVKSVRSDKVTYTVTLEKLMTPTGLEIADGYVYFDMIGAASSYVIKFENNSQLIEREIPAGVCELKELLIPEGNYRVSIKAKGDGAIYGDSDYSEPIDFTKGIEFMELKDKGLINDGYIKWMGRTYYNEDKHVNEVYHSASGFELFFKGSTVVAKINATNYNSSTYRPVIVIVVDDDFDNAKTVFLNKVTQDVALVTGNKDTEVHKIDVYKRSESIDSHISIESIRTDGVFVQKIETKELKMEFIAASSSTGYGNLGSPSSSGKTTENSDCLQGFAFLTAQALNAEISIFSASGWGCYASKWTTPNTASVADEYRNVDFNSKIAWNHALYIPDIVVVNLGTNDWSYINAATTADERDARMNAFQQKYVQFLKYLHDLYPDAQIIVLYGLMNESSIYEVTESIVSIARLAIPNLLSIKINGDAKGYNSHPSVSSHKQIAQTLTNFIKSNLPQE